MVKKFLAAIAVGLSVTMAAGSMYCFADAPEVSEQSYIADNYMADGNERHACEIYGVEEGVKKPVIMEIHGGAFTGGKMSDNSDHCQFWADNGFAAVNIEYTLIPDTDFDGEVQEFFAALNFICDNAEKYGFDTDNVFLSGDSAGSYHVIEISNILNDEELQEYYGVEAPDLDLRGIVLTCTGTDLLAEMVESMKSGEPDDHAKVVGEEILLNDDMMSHYDALTYFNPETFPATFIIAAPADKDKAVGAGPKEFSDYLTENGVEHVYMEYEDIDNSLMHVFNILHTDWIESLQANTDAVNWMIDHLTDESLVERPAEIDIEAFLAETDDAAADEEAAEAASEYTQSKVFAGTYGFGETEITALTNDDFSAFYITFECFDEEQILEGTVADGVVTVDYDLTGFMSGDAQQIWDDAMASEEPWESIAVEEDSKYTQTKVFTGTYGFGETEITAQTNDDFSAFYITFECFDEEQILEGTVADGVVTVDYDLTGFMSGDAQQIWDDAMASEEPWESVAGGETAKYTQTKVFTGTYGFGETEITAQTNDDYSAFYITFECFDEEQILEGTVADGVVTVDYDLTGFMSGDAQQIWDDAMASEEPWEAGSAAAKQQAEAPAAEEPAHYREEELILKNGDADIYGRLFLPETEMEKYPVVIISHGFSSTCDPLAGIAKNFAENGFAAYIYDFIGGSVNSRSGAADGDMTGMSVLTEASDLSAVIDQIKELPNIDPDSLFLLGQSQGGYVSAYVAAQRPEDIKALILQYPAFALQDDCWERYDSIEDIPETEEFMGQVLGAIYSRDAMSMDIYDVIPAYTGDVLIAHGDADPLVDLSYSERAAEVYDNAELIVYEGAGHNFTGEDMENFLDEAVAFAQAHLDEEMLLAMQGPEAIPSDFRACGHRDSYLLQDDSYEATDTEGGYRHYVCSECGAEYSYETAPLVYEVNPVTGEPVTQQGASNPLYENWDFIPDGEPHVFWSRPDNEWRVYVYGSHDEDGITMCGYDQVLWSAPVYDMSAWRYEGVILDFHDIENPVKLYAPDCDYDVNTDTYYMVANQAAPDNKSVLRAADNPCGPWNPEENLLEMRMRLAYDPAIYIEDGTLYIAGSAARAGVEDAGRQDILDAFDADNYSVKHVLSVSRLAGNPAEGFEVEETVFPAADDNIYLALYEAPSFGGWIDELGCYVMLFATEEPMADGGKNHSTICWVYADDLMSDIWHYGENNVDDIVEYTGEEYLSGNKGNVLFDTSGRYHKNMQTGEMEFVNQITYMHGNNHGGMARINGKWYDFGHRPAGNGGAHRQGVAGIVNLYPAEDGTPVIEPVEYTSSGVSEYLDAYDTWNANTTCYLIPGLGEEAAEGGEGQETVEGFDQPYIETTRDPSAEHASYITAIKTGNIVGFKHIGFGDEEKNVTLNLLVSKWPDDIDGVAHVYLDAPDEAAGGVLIGTADLSREVMEAGESVVGSDGTAWYWVSGAMDLPVSGIHPVYLVFDAESEGYICCIDQFSFSE